MTSSLEEKVDMIDLRSLILKNCIELSLNHKVKVFFSVESHRRIFNYCSEPDFNRHYSRITTCRRKTKLYSNNDYDEICRSIEKKEKRREKAKDEEEEVELFSIAEELDNFDRNDPEIEETKNQVTEILMRNWVDKINNEIPDSCVEPEILAAINRKFPVSNSDEIFYNSQEDIEKTDKIFNISKDKEKELRKIRLQRMAEKKSLLRDSKQRIISTKNRSSSNYTPYFLPNQNMEENNILDFISSKYEEKKRNFTQEKNPGFQSPKEVSRTPERIMENKISFVNNNFKINNNLEPRGSLKSVPQANTNNNLVSNAFNFPAQGNRSNNLELRNTLNFLIQRRKNLLESDNSLSETYMSKSIIEDLSFYEDPEPLEDPALEDYAQPEEHSEPLIERAEDEIASDEYNYCKYYYSKYGSFSKEKTEDNYDLLLQKRARELRQSNLYSPERNLQQASNYRRPIYSQYKK